MNPVERVLGAAEALEVAVDGAVAERLVRFAELIARWNTRVRIVGPSDLGVIVDEHIVDALGFARALPHAGAPAWYDIGAGAGLPGLVLAALFPDVRFELVEPVGKKSAFMNHAAATLGLANATVRQARLERLPPGGPTAALSRATFAPEEWARRGADLVGPGGVVLVALGHADAPTLRAQAFHVDDYALPATGARRTTLLLRAPLG